MLTRSHLNTILITTMNSASKAKSDSFRAATASSLHLVRIATIVCHANCSTEQGAADRLNCVRTNQDS